MRRVNLLIAAAITTTLLGCANHSDSTKPQVRATTQATAATTTEAVYARPLDRAISDGVAFLVGDQNADGSWGTGTVSHGNEIVVSVPGSHDAFRVATTALCVMALREVGEHPAHDRGVEYLLSHADVRRGDSELIYNVWTHGYVVEALAGESATNHDPRLPQVVAFHLDRMARYETYTGGWNYYDFNGGTQQPAGGPTSFGTAAGLVSLFAAQQAGFSISSDMVHRGVRRLEEMRLPDGAYLYGSDYKYLQTLPANLPRGSLGRTQTANFALRLWGSKKIDESICRAGLDLFFKDHAAIEWGRKRPYPHESWYQTSGYYYYFDHYYAARLIEMLGPQAKRDYTAMLLETILPHQEPDGSWWDYPMWDYHKPYGTAFALMTLLRCRQ